MDRYVLSVQPFLLNIHYECDRILHMKKGKLTQNGVHLQEHEWQTVKYFLENGKDIILLPKSNIKNFRIADIIMDGEPWEIKAPKGNGRYTAQNILQDAAGQSRNVIIDLHRCKMNDDNAKARFEREFVNSKTIKRMKIIDKSRKMIDFIK